MPVAVSTTTQTHCPPLIRVAEVAMVWTWACFHSELLSYSALLLLCSSFASSGPNVRAFKNSKQSTAQQQLLEQCMRAGERHRKTELAYSCAGETAAVTFSRQSKDEVSSIQVRA